MLFGDAMSSPIDDTAYTQPGLFSIEYALACLWRSWGVEPSWVMGHSVGEYVAACIAGVFSLEDGLKLIAERGRLMQALPQNGDMFAVFADESTVTTAVAPHAELVSIASVNGPTTIVISGERTAIGSVVETLEADGVKTTKLNVSHAFHSPLMDPMLDEFEQFAGGVALSAPNIDLLSNVTGELAGGNVTQPEYWRQHVRNSVRFADSMVALAAAGCELFVEIGPQPHLLGMGRHCVDTDATWIPSLRKGRPERQQMLNAIAELHVRGVTIDWEAFHSRTARRRVPLPTYPFQRERYWVEPTAPSDATQRATTRCSVAACGCRSRAKHVSRRTSPSARRATSRITACSACSSSRGASHTALFLMGANRAFNSRGAEFEELLFLQPFTLTEDGLREAQLVIKNAAEGSSDIELVSLPEGADENDPNAWVVHVSGRVHPTHDAVSSERADIEAIKARCERWLDGPEFYETFWVQKDDAGPAFRWIESIWKRDGEALCQTYLPSLPDDTDSYQLHPGLIEACFQALRCCREFESQRLFAENNEIYVPFGIQKLRFYGKPEGQPLWCHATMRDDAAEGSVIGDLRLYDTAGNLVAEFEGFECRRLLKDVLLKHLQRDRSDWLYRMTWREAVSSETTAPTRNGDWLILADDGGVGERVAGLLTERGEACTIVTAGANDNGHPVGQHRIDPTDPNAFAQLFDGSTTYRGIVYLWSLSATDQDSLEAIQDGQRRGVGGALHVIQALAGAQHDEYPPLWLVTRGTQAVSSDPEPTDIVHAPLWGMARVVELEHPEIPCRRIDLDPTRSASEADQLVAELHSAELEEEIAYRGDKRHIARLTRHGRRAAQADDSVNATSSYLVTGGLGALGLEVAKSLVERGARHIVLTGRSAPSSEAQQTIAELEAAGASVMTVAADVSQRASVEQLFAQIEASSAPLRGIVHAAGTVDDGIVRQLGWDRFESVMAPKVTGTWNLHELSRDLPLDFFVCFSSATSMLGAAGQTNYAAANGFLDAFAHFRRAEGLPALSINWGPWGEVGMAARLDPAILRRMEQHGFEQIPPTHGLRLLEQLMQQTAPQVGVLPINWSRFFEHAHTTPPRFLSDLGQHTAATGDSKASSLRSELIARVASAPERERRQLLIDPVREEVAAVLGLDESAIGLQHGFTDMGMDSLMGIELRRRLQEAFGVRLSSTFAFDYPNVEDATEFLAEQLAGESETDTPAASPRAEEVASEVVEGDIDSSIEEELAKLEASLEKDREDS